MIQAPKSFFTNFPMMTSEIPSCPPKTLQEWRNCKNKPPNTFPRYMWKPLEPFFLSQGYTLWGPSEQLYLEPPNDAPRTLDNFSHDTKYNRVGWKRMYSLVTSIHCPARMTDNRDVLIRLMAIGEDRGENHRTALERLVPDQNVSHDGHVLPILAEIVYQDMIFAVFPLMGSGFAYPWYYRFSEMLDAVEQVLEGVTFCHERLVAHRDLDEGDILINWAGGACQTHEGLNMRRADPFRSLFPIRYYINDFEFAVVFDPESKPESRLVTGLPLAGLCTGKYGRDPAPEMLSEAPYCPFRADVWQLGHIFLRYLWHLGDLSQPLITLFNDMHAEDPNSRPTAAVALARVRQLIRDCENLSASLPRIPPSRVHDNVS